MIPHGTWSKYVNHRCRCRACRAAARDYHAKRRVERKAELAADPTIVPHGRASTYSNWGCRCGKCTAASSEKSRSDYERRKARR